MTSMRPEIDLGPCKVTGAINAARTRVMWEAGTLYVVRSLSDVVSVSCSTRPAQIRGPHQPFVADTTAGLVKFRRAGCTCSYNLAARNGFALMESATSLN